MQKKLLRYGVLSFFSFCFFTGIFHTVVYAQTTTKPDASTANFGLEPTQINPTPFLLQATINPASAPSIKATIIPSQDEQIELDPASSEPAEASSPEPSPTGIPSTAPTPTDIPVTTPTPQAAPVQQAVSGGLNADTLFSMANAHRQSIGKPAFQKDDRLCSLAAVRAPEIPGELAAGTLHSGMYGRNLPYWNTENAIYMNSETAAFNWWINEPIHRQAIEGNYTYSCTACSGIACVQEFSNFQPK